MRTKYIKIPPNSKTDSNKINKSNNDVAEDIADLYRSYISSKNEMEVQTIVIPRNTDGISAQMQSLQTQIDNLSSDATIITMYDENNVIYPTTPEGLALLASNKCSLDINFGEVVLPITSVDVEYHYIDPITGKRSLVQDIDKYVKSFITNNRFKPKVSSLYENSLINAIDLNTSKTHLVKTQTRNSDVDNISIVYNFDTLGTRTINTIRVYPVPENLVRYENIFLISTGGNQQRIIDYTGEEIEMPITNARKRVFRFPYRDITGASVQFNTNDYNIIDSNGTKEFVVGSRIISLENTTYINQGYIGLEVDVPDGKILLEKLTPLYEGYADKLDIAVYSTQEGFDNADDSYLISGNATTILTKLETSLNPGQDKIYILFKLNVHDNGTTPILKGCTIKWQ